MRPLLAAILLLGLAIGPARAQDWSFLTPLTMQALDVRPGDSAPILFSDHPDPGTARYSVIFHYYESRSGGNAIGLNVGLFRRETDGWLFVGPLKIFGIDPRDAQFIQGRVQIATTTQGPNEPRCCPTQVARWSIDVATLQVTRLQ